MQPPAVLSDRSGRNFALIGSVSGERGRLQQDIEETARLHIKQTSWICPPPFSGRSSHPSAIGSPHTSLSFANRIPLRRVSNPSGGLTWKATIADEMEHPQYPDHPRYRKPWLV